MDTEFSDRWFKRRLMKLTAFEKWAMNSPSHAQQTAQMARMLLKQVDLPAQPRCLEIGCGQGALTRLLVEQYGARMTASDRDPRQVAVARKRLADLEGRVDLRVMDGRSMPFEDAQFDAVFSFGVLHHIPRDWRQVIAETARVLGPNGWFVFTDLVLRPDAGRWLGRLLPRLGQLEERALHASLAENGLHLEHYQCVQDGLVTALMPYCTGIARRFGFQVPGTCLFPASR